MIWNSATRTILLLIAIPTWTSCSQQKPSETLEGCDYLKSPQNFLGRELEFVGSVETNSDGFIFQSLCGHGGREKIEIALVWRKEAKPPDAEWDQYILPEPGVNVAGKAPTPRPDPRHFGTVKGFLIGTEGGSVSGWRIEATGYSEHYGFID
ncbi:hypothetical protein WG908_10085 [Sphingobium sp. AN641]|uniref:hypothetical protein n=1 Tax=Sphingobium sp. AN641 TaxID=3133443 RepID=UPI0030BD2376